jgi:hypothetical protein
MNPEFIPGPYDEYRGVVEIDCSEGLPEAVRAALRPTEFLQDFDFAGVLEIDCSSPESSGTSPDSSDDTENAPDSSITNEEPGPSPAP